MYGVSVCGGLLGCTIHVEKHHLSLDPSVIPFPHMTTTPNPPHMTTTPTPLLTYTHPSFIWSAWHWHSDKPHLLSAKHFPLLNVDLKKRLFPSASPHRSFLLHIQIIIGVSQGSFVIDEAQYDNCAKNNISLLFFWMNCVVFIPKSFPVVTLVFTLIVPRTLMNMPQASCHEKAKWNLTFTAFKVDNCLPLYVIKFYSHSICDLLCFL